MSGRTTTRTVWYKRCVFGASDSNLQKLLIKGLDGLESVTQRLWAPAAGGERIGINAYYPRKGMLYGQFLRFEPGLRQPLITVEEGKKAFDLETRGADGSDGKQREFLESLAYFGVLDNHVLFVQSKALRSKEFESYLLWFLGECAKCMAAGDFLILSDQPTSEARERVAKARIKSITIGQPLKAVAIPETVENQAHVRYEASGGVFEGLKQLLDPHMFDHLNLTESLEKDRIEVQVTVKVHGKRQVSKKGRELLEAVSNATRHFDPEDFSLSLASGKLAGDQLKLFKTINVRTTETGGLMDEDALYGAMHSWLEEQILAGMVEA